MQQPPQMLPMMPSFPPTNITTEQIQKARSFSFLFTSYSNAYFCAYGIQVTAAFSGVSDFMELCLWPWM